MSTENPVVRVGKLPGAINTYALNGDHTVAAALGLASITDTAGYEIRVAGEAVTSDYILEDGDDVFLVQKIKGN